MLLIHLSDVHLKSADYKNLMDPNQLLRAKLQEDISYMCNTLGDTPKTIIISGDIAFSGQEKEYQFAREWLQELCINVGADYSSIFITPGNHDIDRSVSESGLVSALVDKVRSTKKGDTEQELIKIISEKNVAEILLKQIENYNNFAKDFSCDLNFSDKPHVTKRIEIEDGISLVLWGLNSVIVSDSKDSESEKNLLVVPSYRTILEQDGEVNIVVCHHPYNWLGNGKEFHEHVTNTAKVLLFGHEHENRFVPTQDYVHVSASAVIPERDGGKTNPGYNIFNINLQDDGAEKSIVIDLYMREWQNNPPKFREKQPKANAPFLRNIFPIKKARTRNDPLPGTSSEPSSLQKKTDIAEFVSTQIPEQKNTVDSIQHDERSLQFLFMNLSISDRRSIARSLKIDISELRHLNDKDASNAILDIIFEQNLDSALQMEIIEKSRARK
ncbi:Calcineurin-like phosphoesterase superfamily domain [Serratia quinivorans]|uniref:metallophosphoesterase family protein n=1 Tax=Serratia quinivorans TaxID=137545 RepID=UPI00217C83F7|nr:metallophosphoesterase [Serratia quinivorans]CAI1532202.1 Calcineurin-like phosphoesterase superfamily domain [Serratia quinivorans]CAI1725504.1 Calcineurin-like phosphoesterase superfamily domain [Serratia quinivorans]